MLPPWRWLLLTGMIALVAIVAGIKYALPLRDSDIWFHLAYGRYFWQVKTLIPDHTLFSWTPVTGDTIYCTWLADLLLYALYSVGDLPALFILRYCCLFFFIALFLWYARQLQLLWNPITWLLCLLGILLADVAIFAKPEIFTFVMMTGLVATWWHIRSFPSRWPGRCYLIPLILLLWVNSHGGVIFGYTFLIVVIAGELCNKWSGLHELPAAIQKHIFLSAVLGFITILLTPYGLSYPVYLAQHIIPTTENLQNFNSIPILAYVSPFSNYGSGLSFANLGNLALFMMLIITLPAVKSKTLDWSLLLSNLVFALLYTSMGRTTFYWAPVLAFSMMYLLGKRQNFLTKSSGVTAFFLYATTSSIMLLVALTSIRNSLCSPDEYMHAGFGSGDGTPVQAARFIKKNFPNRNIGNTYNQGSYLLWELWPSNKIMIDSRYFPFRSWIGDFFAFGQQPWKYQTFMEQNKADIWCIGLHKPQLYLWFLASVDWKLAYYGKNSAVFVREHIPLPQKHADRRTDFDSLQNPYAAMAALRFALVIQDWPIAAKIISQMQSTFTCTSQQALIANAISCYEAYKAYFLGNYKEAIYHLTHAAENGYFINQGMTADAYTHLASEAWEAQKNNLALIYTIKALKEYQTTEALFNYGLICSYAEYKSDESLTAACTSFSWRDSLNMMKNRSRGKADGINLVRIANAVITGEAGSQRLPLAPLTPGRLLTSGKFDLNKF